MKLYGKDKQVLCLSYVFWYDRGVNIEPCLCILKPTSWQAKWSHNRNEV